MAIQPYGRGPDTQVSALAWTFRRLKGQRAYLCQPSALRSNDKLRHYSRAENPPNDYFRLHWTYQSVRLCADLWG
jgi:hypothetical protein